VKQAAVAHHSHVGRRAGAGRKPKNGFAGVGRDTRAVLASRLPAHVTMKVRRGLPRLRSHSARFLLGEEDRAKATFADRPLADHQSREL